MGPAIGRFLKAVERLAKNKDITINEVYDFAKREFGEVSDLLKVQINRIFKQSDAPSIKKPKPEGEVIEASFKPGKSKYNDKVIEESPSQASGIMTTEEATPLMSRLEKGAETLRGFKKPGMDLTTGMARTAARVILDNAGIKVPEKVDPIEVIAKEFGGDVLMDLRDVAEELIEKERTGRITESMGEFLESRGMFDLKRGRTDVPKGMSDEELQQIKKEVDQEKMLKDFDPTDREPNSMGGINRTGFSGGGIKAVMKLINTKFGKDTIGKLEDFYQQAKLKLNPEAKKFQEDRKAIFDFNMRQLNKTEAEANKKMDDIIKDQIEGGFIRDMEKSMQKDMQRELTKPERKILDVPEVPKGFTTSKEKLLEQFPEIDEDFAEQMMDMDKDLLGRTIMMLKDRRKDPDAYDRLLAEYGDTLEFQKEFDKVVRRKKNSEGGLNYLMGM